MKKPPGTKGENRERDKPERQNTWSNRIDEFNSEQKPQKNTGKMNNEMNNILII